MYGRPTFTTDGESIWFSWRKSNYLVLSNKYNVINCLKEQTSVSSPNFYNHKNFRGYFQDRQIIVQSLTSINASWLCLFRTGVFPYAFPCHIYLTTKEKEKRKYAQKIEWNFPYSRELLLLCVNGFPISAHFSEEVANRGKIITASTVTNRC